MEKQTGAAGLTVLGSVVLILSSFQDSGQERSLQIRFSRALQRHLKRKFIKRGNASFM